MKPLYIFFFILLSPLIVFSEKPITFPSGIKVFHKKRELHVPITVVNHKGGLEFILSHGLNKDYESVFSTKCKGKELHLALLAINLLPTPYLNFDSLNKIHHQSKCSLYIQFDTEPQPIQNFLLWKYKDPLKENSFFFAGSYFRKIEQKNVYMADTTLCLIAAYPAPEMIIGLTQIVDNPYDGVEGKYLTPNPKTLPPIKTKGFLIIRATSRS